MTLGKYVVIREAAFAWGRTTLKLDGSPRCERSIPEVMQLISLDHPPTLVITPVIRVWHGHLHLQ